jgi:hypothetical protein
MTPHAGGLLAVDGDPVSKVTRLRRVAEGLSRRRCLPPLLGAAIVVLLAVVACAAAPTASAAPGDLLWSTLYPDPLQPNVDVYTPVHVVRGPGGDIWASTTWMAEDTRNRDVLVVRYAPTGLQRWALQTGAAGGSEYGLDIAVGRDKTAVVTGQSVAKGMWTIKVASSGKRVWARVLAGAGDLHYGLGRAVAMDSHGNAYVVGTLRSAKRGDDMLVAKYSPSGRIQWKRYLYAPGAGNDVGVDVAVGPGDKVYVTGTLQTTKQGKNVVVARYASTGALVWKKTWDAGAAASDGAVALAASKAGVAVAATSDPATGDQVGVVLTARPVMRRSAKLKTRVSAVAGRDVTWNDVGFNDRGDVAACGSTYLVTAYEFTYARWLAGGPAILVNQRPPSGTANAGAVWLSSQGDMVVAGYMSTSLSRGLHVRRVARDGAMWASNTNDHGFAESLAVAADGVCAGGRIPSSVDQLGLWMFAP